MPEQKLSDYDLLDTPEDEPIVLIGQPDALCGEVKVRNPGDHSVILRETRLHKTPVIAPTQKRARKAAAPGEIIHHPISTVVLRPGQSQRIPLKLSLGDHTPPGVYEGEIEVAGRKRPVVYYVTEMLALDISPTSLVIENHPGATIVKQVIISNAGNVPLNIREFGPVVLDVERLDCIVGRAAVSKADQFETLDQYFVEQVRQTKRVNEDTGILRVRNASGPATLEPGEVRSFSLQVRVPERLEKRFRYFGTVPIYTENLVFVIVPVNGEPISQKPERASRTRIK